MPVLSMAAMNLPQCANTQNISLCTWCKRFGTEELVLIPITKILLVQNMFTRSFCRCCIIDVKDFVYKNWYCFKSRKFCWHQKMFRTSFARACYCSWRRSTCFQQDFILTSSTNHPWSMARYKGQNKFQEGISLVARKKQQEERQNGVATKNWLSM
jgi:hypothetical protein